MTQQDSQLTVIAKENGIEEGKIDALLSNFSTGFQKAKKIVEECKNIEITSEDQTDEMATARESRLKLKNIRVEIEKTRKTLKEQSLREGRAIDGMANIIKALIVPVEEHLEKQEKFIEIKIKERKLARQAERIEKLSRYVEDVSLYNLEDMEDEAFDKLLANTKKAFEDEKKAQEEAEKERKIAEEERLKEQERIRKENERLKAEADAREAEANKINEIISKIYSFRDSNIISLKELDRNKSLQDDYLKTLTVDNEQIKEAIANNNQWFTSRKQTIDAENTAKEEREAREKLEAEAQAKAQAEAKARAEKEEAERKALLAPDKDKLVKLADQIDNLTMPAVEDREAGKVLDETKDFLNRVSKNLRKKAKEL